jgi:hypothetical protein
VSGPIHLKGKIMFHLLLKLLLAGAVMVCVCLALLHAFPVVFIALAIIGLVRLYQILRGPKYPPGPWR